MNKGLSKLHETHFSDGNLPKMVDTNFHCCYNDEAQKNISESAKSPKAKIALSEAAGALKIDVSDAPSHDDATVFLAIAEDNLTTKVGGGENGGRTLEHASVVRQLNPLGRIEKPLERFQLFPIFPNSAPLLRRVFVRTPK